MNRITMHRQTPLSVSFTLTPTPPNDSGIDYELLGRPSNRVATAEASVDPPNIFKSSTFESSTFKRKLFKTKRGKILKKCARCGTMAKSNRQNGCKSCHAFKEWAKPSKKAPVSKKKRKAEDDLIRPVDKKKKPLVNTTKLVENISSEKSKASELNIDFLDLIPEEFDEEVFDEIMKNISCDDPLKLTRTPSLIPLEPPSNQMKLDIEARDLKIKQLEAELNQHKKREAELKEMKRQLRLQEVFLHQRDMDLQKKKDKMTKLETNLKLREAILIEDQLQLEVREAKVNLIEVRQSDEMYELMNDALQDFPVVHASEDDLIIEQSTFHSE